MYDTAPKNVLSSSFPDQKGDDEIIQEILKKGDFQTMEVRARNASMHSLYFLDHKRLTKPSPPADARPPGCHERLFLFHEDQINYGYVMFMNRGVGNLQRYWAFAMVEHGLESPASSGGFSISRVVGC